MDEPIKHKIGFDITEVNFTDGLNPPDTGGGNENNPNEPGEDPDDLILPPVDPDDRDVSEVIPNIGLSNYAHEKWLEDLGQSSEQRKTMILGFGLLASLLFLA